MILQNTFLGQWVDADLGNFDDDYVGCDVTRGLGICYNGKPVDEGFSRVGSTPLPTTEQLPPPDSGRAIGAPTTF